MRKAAAIAALLVVLSTSSTVDSAYASSSWALIVEVPYSVHNDWGLKWDVYVGVSATFYLPSLSYTPSNVIFLVLTLSDEATYFAQVAAETGWCTLGTEDLCLSRTKNWRVVTWYKPGPLTVVDIGLSGIGQGDELRLELFLQGGTWKANAQDLTKGVSKSTSIVSTGAQHIYAGRQEPFAFESYTSTESDFSSNAIVTSSPGVLLQVYDGSSWYDYTGVANVVNSDTLGFVGEHAPTPSWFKAAGCNQQTAMSAGALKMGYNIVGTNGDNKVLWPPVSFQPLPGKEMAWIDPNTVALGGSFKAYYRVGSAYPSSVGLGLSIRTGLGEEVWGPYDDPSHDVVVQVGSGITVLERTFTIPSNVPTGRYDVGFSLWSGQPEASTLWVGPGGSWHEKLLQIGGLSSAIRISTNTGDSVYPSVAASGSYVYVAWQDDTLVSGSGSNPEIWLRASYSGGGSFGSAIRISTNTGYSERPSVAAVGNYVYVAWQDDTLVTGGGACTAYGCPYEVWMRASSNYGSSFGSAVRISTNTGYSKEPSVAAVGNYVYVAWQDDTPVPGSGGCAPWGCPPEVWMRVSNNNGVSFGSPVRISTNTYDSLFPSVAAVGSNVYVAWVDYTPVPGSGFSAEIWTRASSNNGATFGTAVRITTNTGESIYPSVAADGSYVFIAWQDTTLVSGSNGQSEIWMRVSNNYGATYGSAIRMSYNAYISYNPSVAASGGYVCVAWDDYTPVPGSGSDSNPEVWMRVSSNAGGTFGSATRVTTNTGYSGDPSVALASPFGTYTALIAWNDDTPVSGSGVKNDIWFRIGYL